MIRCQKCGIDRDLCDCPVEERELTIEDKIKLKEWHDKMSDFYKLEIIKDRKKNGKIL